MLSLDQRNSITRFQVKKNKFTKKNEKRGGKGENEERGERKKRKERLRFKHHLDWELILAEVEVVVIKHMVSILNLETTIF